MSPLRARQTTSPFTREAMAVPWAPLRTRAASAIAFRRESVESASNGDGLTQHTQQRRIVGGRRRDSSRRR